MIKKIEVILKISKHSLFSRFFRLFCKSVQLRGSILNSWIIDIKSWFTKIFAARFTFLCVWSMKTETRLVFPELTNKTRKLSSEHQLNVCFTSWDSYLRSASGGKKGGFPPPTRFCQYFREFVSLCPDFFTSVRCEAKHTFWIPWVMS